MWNLESLNVKAGAHTAICLLTSIPSFRLAYIQPPHIFQTVTFLSIAHTSMYMYVYVCVCVCVCIYIYIYIYIYISREREREREIERQRQREHVSSDALMRFEQ